MLRRRWPPRVTKDACLERGRQRMCHLNTVAYKWHEIKSLVETWLFFCVLANKSTRCYYFNISSVFEGRRSMQRCFSSPLERMQKSETEPDITARWHSICSKREWRESAKEKEKKKWKYDLFILCGTAREALSLCGSGLLKDHKMKLKIRNTNRSWYSKLAPN